VNRRTHAPHRQSATTIINKHLNAGAPPLLYNDGFSFPSPLIDLMDGPPKDWQQDAKLLLDNAEALRQIGINRLTTRKSGTSASPGGRGSGAQGKSDPDTTAILGFAFACLYDFAGIAHSHGYRGSEVSAFVFHTGTSLDDVEMCSRANTTTVQDQRAEWWKHFRFFTHYAIDKAETLHNHKATNVGTVDVSKTLQQAADASLRVERLISQHCTAIAPTHFGRPAVNP